MNKQQPHAGLESEKKKLQTEKDKLGNRHNDPDHMVDTIWYKDLWRALKKQAKKIANSNADADSSSDESVSFDSHGTRRPSDSTGNNFEKLVSNENLAIRSSKGVQVNHSSQKREKCDKKEPSVQASIILDKNCMYTHPLTPAVSSYPSIPNQLKNAAADKRTFDSHGTRRPSDSTKNNFEEHFVSNKNLASQRSKGVKVKSESQKRDKYPEIKEPFHHPSMILESTCVNKYKMTPPVSSDVSIPNQINDLPEEMRMEFNNRSKQNSKKEERCNTQVNEKENKDEEKEEVNGENVVSSQNLERPTTQDQRQDEGREVTRLRPEQILSLLSNKWINVMPEVRRNFINRSKSIHSQNISDIEQKLATSLKREEICDKLKKSVTDLNNLTFAIGYSSFMGIDTCTEFADLGIFDHDKFLYDIKTLIYKTEEEQIERYKSTEASDGSTNRPIHPVDQSTTYNSQEENRIGMRGSMVSENRFKVQDQQIPSSEANTDASSDESVSTVESTLIRLYRNVKRNETSRMMSSIGIEAEHLFGLERSQIFFGLLDEELCHRLERSQIFFDLLDEELCHFGSALSDSVPNMAESTVRQNVISFFEHASDTMNRLMTSCPDSKRLQQMPEQNFISLMKSVIKSSLDAHTKGREKLSLEGNIYTMADPKDFERALVDKIPEDVLNRLGNGDEMVVHRFVDTILERHQSSDREENRPIHCIYFPSDCRLFIYIPIANGSYWHHSEMQRAKRIRRHSI